MRVADARAEVCGWLDSHGDTSGIEGAYLTGSTLWMAATAELPSCSDVDLKLVLGPGASLADAGLGKQQLGTRLLDVSTVSADRFEDPEALLGDYQLAPPFSRDCVLLDRSGLLAATAAYVRPRFHESSSRLRRAAHARARLEYWSRGASGAEALHDRVTASLFAAGVAAHVLLSAAGWNPTVRRRFADCRELLAPLRDLQGTQDALLTGLGAAGLAREELGRWLEKLGAAFDLACERLRSPYRFASDMTPAARPVAVAGVAQMVAEGAHREAAYWLAVVYCRARAVLSADAPETLERFDEDYVELLQCLGLADDAARAARMTRLETLMEDQIWPAAVALAYAAPLPAERSGR